MADDGVRETHGVAEDMPGGEALIYDAHLPSMTARFRIPEGLPFAAGLYRLEYLRPPTDEDRARWAHFPEPPDESAIEDVLQAIVDCYGVGSTPEQFCRNVADFIEEARTLLTTNGDA